MTSFFEIGPFRLEPHASVLIRDGIAVPLGRRAVAVLTTLVEHPNEYIPKARIIDVVWPSVIVEESNLAVQIAAIRRVLAQGGGSRWIETLPRRGYRFVGPVSVVRESSARAGVGGERSNLPQPLTSFIGRERELREIKRLLPACRLLTLSGTGGIGKTRLALEAGAGLVDAYPDGVWFVDFGALSDPGLVASAVAQVLGARETAGKPLIDALLAYLKRRQLLLILDNCEHLLPGCASLAQTMLQHAAGLAILATSREPLQIPPEQSYVLESLPLPDPTANAETMKESDAVRLFVERARRHQPGFALTQARAQIVAELCIHLDGIPLALELAAARIHSLSVEQIHARLDNRFRLLTDGGRTALPRHQTLRATFDWSFDLLAEEERRVLRRLAVFAAGFTLEAAMAVASDPSIDEHAVIDVLRQLVLRSLVTADTSEAAARYRFLETTRAYALGKLGEAGETNAIKRRHAEYFRDLFEPAADEWLRLPDAEWYAVYKPELDNVRAALAWAFGPGGDPEIAISLAAGTRPLWSALPLNEGRHWLEAALSQIGARTALTEQARLWSGLGTLLTAAQPTRAAAALERGVELYRRTGDMPSVGKSLLGLGRAWVCMGRFEPAAAALAEARPLLERANEPKALARYFETFAFLKMLTGDTTSARAHFEKALSRYRSAGAESFTLAVLVNLADLTWAMGDLDAALIGFQGAIALIRKSANVPRDMLGVALTNLAGVHTERGELAEALAAAKEGLPLRQPEDLYDALDHLALRAALAGKLSEASRLAGFADEMWTASQAIRRPNEARARDRLQALLREKLSMDEVEQLLAEGAKLFEDEACRLALDDATGRASRPSASPRNDRS